MDEVTIAIEQAKTQRSLPPPAARRHLRRAVGLSLSVIARALGVTVVTVSRWERGTRTPSRRRAASYADLLDRFARAAREREASRDNAQINPTTRGGA